MSKFLLSLLAKHSLSLSFCSKVNHPSHLQTLSQQHHCFKDSLSLSLDGAIPFSSSLALWSYFIIYFTWIWNKPKSLKVYFKFMVWIFFLEKDLMGLCLFIYWFVEKYNKISGSFNLRRRGFRSWHQNSVFFCLFSHSISD